MNQSDKFPAWIGGIQSQVANSSYYTVWYSNVMMALTFWTVAGYPMAQKYAPWLSLWLFLALMIGSIVAALILDWIFFQPARMKYLNAQSCKHENPWMDELLIVKSDVKQTKLDVMETKDDVRKIKEKLGIE